MNFKRIIYNANHRGLKEMDVLLGGFATRCFADLSDEDQSIFERLLEEQDANILDWCLEKTVAPEEYQQMIYLIVNGGPSVDGTNA